MECKIDVSQIADLETKVGAVRNTTEGQRVMAPAAHVKTSVPHIKAPSKR